MHKLCTQILLTLAIFVALPGTLAQAAQAVTVSLPNFPITLNGMSVDNVHRTYPFVVYKDTTYCPMTFYDSRFLGLETSFDDESGFTVETTDVICGFRKTVSNKRHTQTEKAYVADFPVTVNGQLINNALEEYPILVLHDVTYFPLSRRYAEEAFEWEYHYDDSKGLVIRSKNAVMLPKAIPHFTNNGPLVYSPEILLDNGQLYYGGEDGGIYRVSLDNLNKPQKLFQKKMSESDLNDPYYWPTELKDVGQNVWVVHQGVLINKHTGNIKKVNHDGLESAGYPYNDINVAVYDNKLFYVDGRRLNLSDGQRIEPGNLYMEQDDGKRVQIGDKRYIYGKISHPKGLGSNDAIDFANNAVYIVAAKPGYPEQFGSTLCMIDLATNETTELYHTNGDSILEWAIAGENLYYLAECGESEEERKTYSLFVRSLKDGNTSNVSAVIDMTDIRDLKKVGETIYFIGFIHEWGTRTLQNPKQSIDLYGYRAYDPIKYEFSRWVNRRIETYESHGYYIYCMLDRMGYDPNTDYRTIILDPEGHLVFRSADIVQNVTVDQLGNVAYTIEGQPDIYFGRIENRGVGREIRE